MRIPAYLSFEAWLDCNLGCTYCCSPKQNRPALTVDELLKLLHEAKGVGINYFIVSGGEPLLRIKQLEKIITPLIDSGITISLLTNGTLFKQAGAVELLQKFNDIRVSIDEPPVEQSEFRIGSSPQKIYDDIKYIRELFPNLIIAITTLVNKSNVFRLNDMYDQIMHLDIDAWRLGYFYYRGRAVTAIARDKFKPPTFADYGIAARRILKRYLKESPDFELDILHMFSYADLGTDVNEYSLMDNPCAYQNGLFVNTYGDLLLCPNYETPLLNIRDYPNLQKALEAKDSALVKRHNPILTLHLNDLEACRSCRYLRICGGGCRGQAMSWFDDIFAPDPIICSLRTVWEKYVLDIYPLEIKNKYRALIDKEGKNPPEFGGINEILDNQEKGGECYAK